MHGTRPGCARLRWRQPCTRSASFSAPPPTFHARRRRHKTPLLRLRGVGEGRPRRAARRVPTAANVEESSCQCRGKVRSTIPRRDQGKGVGCEGRKLRTIRLHATRWTSLYDAFSIVVLFVGTLGRTNSISRRFGRVFSRNLLRSPIFLSDTMYLSISFGKSTPPQNRQVS